MVPEPWSPAGAPRALGRRVVPILGCVLALLGAVRLGERRAEVDHRVPAAIAGDREEAAETGETGETGERPTVLFVFQPGDCPAFGGLFDLLSEVERSGAARVLGVGVRLRLAGPPAARGRALPLPIPIRSDVSREGERLILGLGYRRTPVLVLLDREGRVRLAAAAPRDSASQRRLVEVVREHATGLAAEGET